MTIPSIAPYQLPPCADIPQTKLSWRPDPSRALLLVHDMQAYFLSFYDAAQSPVREVLTNVATLQERCRKAGVPVLYSAQPAEPERARRGLLNDMWGPGLLAHPELAQIADAVAPQSGERVLEKTRYSAFQGTELLTHMRSTGRDQLWIVGVFAHIGCMLTAAEAFMQDIQVFFVADGVADFSRAYHDSALSYVASRCGVVLETVSLCAAIEQVSPPSRDDLGRPIAYDVLDRALASLLDRAPGSVAADVVLRDIGLDSVRTLELADELAQQGFEVSVVDLLECDTLVAMRRCLDRRETSSSGPEALR